MVQTIRFSRIDGEDRRCASRYTSGTFSNPKFPDKVGWVNLHDPALVEIAEGSDIVFWDLPKLVVVVAAQGNLTSDGVMQGNGLRRCVQFRAVGEVEPDGANAGKIKANAAHGAKIAKLGQTECALPRLASCRFKLQTWVMNTMEPVGHQRQVGRLFASYILSETVTSVLLFI